MMLMKKHCLRIVLCMVFAVSILFSVFAMPASAEVPSPSYSYWDGFTSSGKKAVYSKSFYSVLKIIDDSVLKTGAFVKLSDVFCDEDGTVYILDGGSSSITVLNKDYSLQRCINSIKKNGEAIKFDGAQGIFVSKNDIFIADTDNERVIVTDKNGNYKREIKKPESSLIPENYAFRPVAVQIDRRGYTYILCDGSFYGALLYSPEDEFLGFYGSNEVGLSAIEGIKNLITELFNTDEKKSASIKALPYQFVDFCMDSEGILYTVTSRTESKSNKKQTGQIKKLSPGSGTNILESDSVNFGDEGQTKAVQNFVGVSVSKDDFIYALDSAYGKVYIYDSECRLINAFGGGLGAGKQKGTFELPCAVELNGYDVLIADSLKNTITVYSINDFGKDVLYAQSLTIKGNYKEALPLWEKILALDVSCQTAYSGIAQAEYANGNYKKSMDYAKEGLDRETYSKTFVKIRSEFIRKYFTFLVLLLVAVIVAVVVLVCRMRKRGKKLIKNVKIKTALEVLTHPFNAFAEIKEKNLGSIKICIVILASYYVTSVLEYLCGGFSFTYFDASEFDSVQVLATSIGLIVLWVVSNWAVATLLGGIGKMKQIFIVACYSIVPLVFGQIVYIIMSNILVSDEAAFLTIFITITKLYTAFLLIVGTIVIHDFSFSKFFGSTVLTILFMAVIVFLIILFILLIQQLGGFIATMFMEIYTR